MRVLIKVGDLLEEQVDVLISSANVHLAMSGGVNGAILERGGEVIQRELKAYLAAIGRSWVPAGSMVRTGPGPLEVRHLLHAVAIDGFYGSSVELVSRVIASALAEASRLGAKTVALPALATGYGPLSMTEFAEALRSAVAHGSEDIEELRVVLRDGSAVQVVRDGLRGSGACPA